MPRGAYKTASLAPVAQERKPKMSDEKRSEIVEKIKKLLAHSVENGATEAEAVAFALKAQRLIAENDIEQWELGDEQRREVIEEESNVNLPRSWSRWLATVVAENFRCKLFLRPVEQGGHVKNYAVFVGYAQDAQAARIVFERLRRVAERAANASRKKHRGASWAYNSITLGFVEGVKGELEKQCQALMLKVPSDVSDYFEDLSLTRTRKSPGCRVSNSLLEEGRETGRDAVRAGRMSKPDDSYMLTA